MASTAINQHPPQIAGRVMTVVSSEPTENSTDNGVNNTNTSSTSTNQDTFKVGETGFDLGLESLSSDMPVIMANWILAGKMSCPSIHKLKLKGCSPAGAYGWALNAIPFIYSSAF
jgi:hypothetical protein